MIKCKKCSWQIEHNEDAIQLIGVTLKSSFSGEKETEICSKQERNEMELARRDNF